MLYKIIQELYEKEKENLLKSEELVAQKEEIELQNQKLLEYAFYNAHKVRGPLARILGLVYLLKREADNIGFVDKDRYLEKLSESANELDIAVREMSHFLDE
jgi:light-regulated signal transduction histidine kinase (bacteriophytochrome)